MLSYIWNMLFHFFFIIECFFSLSKVQNKDQSKLQVEVKIKVSIYVKFKEKVKTIAKNKLLLAYVLFSNINQDYKFKPFLSILC